MCFIAPSNIWSWAINGCVGGQPGVTFVSQYCWFQFKRCSIIVRWSKKYCKPLATSIDSLERVFTQRFWGCHELVTCIATALNGFSISGVQRFCSRNETGKVFPSGKPAVEQSLPTGIPWKMLTIRFRSINFMPAIVQKYFGLSSYSR